MKVYPVIILVAGLAIGLTTGSLQFSQAMASTSGTDSVAPGESAEQQEDQRTDSEPTRPSAARDPARPESWDTQLHLSPLPTGRSPANDWPVLRFFPAAGGREALNDEDAAPLRSTEIGGLHVDAELVEDVFRNHLRRTHDLGHDMILEFGLIQPRTARSSNGPSFTTVGMRLQLNTAWEIHAGYGAAFGSGSRAQVGLSLKW